MRSFRSSAWLLGLTVAALVNALACGTTSKPPKSADEVKNAGAGEGSETAESSGSTQGTSEEPDASSAPAGAGQSCPHDTSKTVASGIGNVHVSGCMSPDAAAKMLQQYDKQLRGCYGQAKVKKTKTPVDIRINVGQNGIYSVRVVKTDITEPEFASCLVEVLETLPYPKPDFEGATIEFSMKP